MEPSVRPLHYTPTAEDKAWGIYVLSIGSGTAPPPHREGWQLHYIVRGAANLQVPGNRPMRNEAGTVVLENAQHKALYAANLKGDFHLHWIEFGGDTMDKWYAEGFFGTLPCVVQTGFDENLLGMISKIVEISRSHPPGAKRLVAGILGNFMARLEVAVRLGGGNGHRRQLVQDVRQLLNDPTLDQVALDGLADQLGISYSWFRRTFRSQTGVTPQRFRCQRRMETARQLLADSSLSVGAIAERLGFTNQSYFTRMFRKETGLSPSVWRASQTTLLKQARKK